MTDGLRLEGFGCRAVHDIDLHIAPGQSVGLTGPSGTGKSLLLRAVADLDPHEGQVWLDAVEVNQVSAPVWRRRVGLLPAEAAWWFDTVGDHFGGIPPPELEALGFGRETMSWQISHLSSGERQRLALLRLMANQPRVLLLDEPTANLDETNTRRAEDLIEKFRRAYQPVILWVSHDLAQLRRCCAPILVLAGGRLDALPPGGPGARPADGMEGGPA